MQGEPEICRDFRKGVCFRVNCRYAHINADGTPGTPNDQPVCRDFENGRCFRSNCRFFHRSAPELLAANLANSKRQGEPSPHDLLDRFGPLGMNHPDFPSYPLGGNDLSPSGEFSRDARALLARELAKRELAISNRMLELSLAERALLELSIRERRQALGRLDPGLFQSLGRRDSVPVPGFHDLAQMGVRPSPTLPSALNRTRSVPVQGFQDLRGVAPQRHTDVIPGPRLDRRGSGPGQGMDMDGGEQEGSREGGGFGWQPPGASERGEFPPGMGNPPLGRSTSETVQHLQEMRRAADSLLLDLERARRKESLSVPGSPELVGGDRAPQLELDPRILNRAGGARGPGVSTEEAHTEGAAFQALERYASLRSATKTPEVQGQAPAPLQKYASEPLGRGGGTKQELEGRKSPQAVSDPRKSPEPMSDDGRMYGGVREGDENPSMHGSERDGQGGLLSPEEGDPRKSRSLQASPETNAVGSQGFSGFGRAPNGLTSQGLQGMNTNVVGGGMTGQELRRAGKAAVGPPGTGPSDVAFESGGE
ncbi:hypothetical protein KFL_002210020 [Klebsormidium nitens]|uniref:C3H1-type domain-containing protein n=1 Tax=Klebsormidium nitens TaxID=105231 RepID=A0A1Y1IAL1_KLENI|nr:hypothetical protein KFL_002210020 [Klebsormidium nitens]|eukprot:GAQ85138.1 hypothetical protein KFL_002210020 [Klebsormidium nitens]